jgi:hypothetical protein
MIDSIHIRLHNLQRYQPILNYLLNHSDRNMYEDNAHAPMKGQDKMFYLKIVEFKTEGKTLIQSNGHKLTSSHYSLGWNLPTGDKSGTVDFNFSIPKMVYGTNIIQFVPHKTEFNSTRYFDWSEEDSYKANQKITYKRLMIFIHKFFRYFTRFGETIVDPNDIEIMRFDICWNQYFNCKKDALEYLNYQKNVKKKHLRMTSKNQKSYPTSVFYSTRDYGCKIYHKGTEYRSPKGERNHHLKANKQIKNLKANGNFIQKGGMRMIPYDVEKLAEHADKILRYEITFRRAYLSKIFRKKVFRRKNEVWQRRMKQWKECHRIHQYATGKNTLKKEKRAFWLSVYLGRVNMNDEYTRYWIHQHKLDFKSIDLSVGLQKSHRNFYKWWLKKREHYISFRLGVSEETREKNMVTATYMDLGSGIEKNLPFEARFSPILLKECFKIFNDFRDHFEIKEKTDLSSAQRSLDLYNKNIDELNKMKRAEEMPGKKMTLYRGAKTIIKLLENDTLDGLVEKGLICRKTAYNYEKKFEALNFNLHTGSIFEIWNDRGFEEYHRTLWFDGLEKYLQNNIFG